MQEEFLTIKEVAEMLGVTNETVRLKCRSRHLKGVKVGSHWRIRKSELDKFLKNSYKTNI